MTTDSLGLEFVSRKKKRPNYSLRSFARELGMSPSFLSQVLAGKRKLSLDKAYEVAKACKWNDEISKRFISEVVASKAREEAVAEYVYDKIKPVKVRTPAVTLADDLMLVLSDMTHTAILVLTQFDDFSSDPNWIAKKLGVTAIEADNAIRRLLTVGLLKKNADGTLKYMDVHIKSEDDKKITASRMFHFEVLKRAMVALQRDDIRAREIRGITVATDVKLLPKVKEKIRDFEIDLLHFLESGKKNAVYHYESLLFRVDKTKTSRSTTH